MTDLFGFAEDVLIASGGLVEKEGLRLTCLLEAETAHRLELPEEWTLGAPHGAPESPLTPDSTELETLLGIARGDGRAAHVRVDGPQPRTGGLLGEIADKIQLVNTIGEPGPMTASTCSYLRVYYDCLAEAGPDRDRVQVSVSFNDETLAETPWLGEALGGNHPLFDSTPGGWKRGLEEVIARADSLAADGAQDQLRPFLGRVRRRVSRARRQLERIHRRERKEAAATVLAEDATPQKKTGARRRLARMEREYLEAAARIGEEQTIAVSAVPFAAVRATIPVTRIEYRVRRRKESRVLALIWNPIIDGVEPMACEGCGRSSYQIACCDQVHILCNTCQQQCPICRP